MDISVQNRTIKERVLFSKVKNCTLTLLSPLPIDITMAKSAKLIQQQLEKEL